MTASATRTAHVLIVDDEQSILDATSILLRDAGFQASTAHGGRRGLEQLASLRPDIVLSDIRMPDASGLEVLAAARAQDPDMPVILMTAQATLQSAMQAVNEGAFHYVQKPFRNDDLLAIVHRASEHRELRSENRKLKREVRRRDLSVRPIGASSAWMTVMKLAETVAPTESTVLLQGESGTGKEVVARYLHDLSARADGPFLSINCGALPESLLESELFGHVKGSFTGAVKDKSGLFTAAARGTFFLDEVGEMTPATQVKLLRVLQQREVIPVGATEAIPVDTRVIAATNRDLEQEIRRGAFRSDLYYRLNVIALNLPPLRERKDDIPLFVDAFLRKTADSRGGPPKALGSGALDALQSYAWPGNVRELENALESAMLVTRGATIEASGLPAHVRERAAEPLVSDVPRHNPSLDTIERAYIMWVLENEHGNKTRAADVLGIDPSTLHRKLQKFGAAS